MFIFFQAIYLEKWGANPLTIGAVLGFMGVAMTIAQIPAGYLADRVGRRPVMWASWILGALSAWVMALATSLPGFITGLLLYGITSFVLAPMNSYVTAARGKWSVARALTFVSAMFNLGAVIGPLIGGQLGERFGLRSVYIISACIFVFSTLIVLLVRAQPIHSHTETESKTHLFQNSRFVGYLAIAGLTIFAAYLPQPLTPNFLQNERGLSLAAIGQLGSASSLGSALIALALGRLSAGTAFLIGQGLVALFVIFLWRGTGMAWYSMGYFLLGGYRLCRSMILALGRPLVRPSEIGLAFGAIETVNSSAFILAPLLAGILYNQNPAWLYPVSLGFLGLSLLVSGLFLWRIRQTQAAPIQAFEASAD